MSLINLVRLQSRISSIVRVHDTIGVDNTFGSDLTVGNVTCINAMGWLRSVGSIKLQVSFAEYCLFYRALLQKRPIILSILLTEATPYLRTVYCVSIYKVLVQVD